MELQRASCSRSLTSSWSALSPLNLGLLGIQNCSYSLIQTENALKVCWVLFLLFFKATTARKKTQLPLYTAKRNGKRLHLGDKTSVPFALSTGKCLASSPHPSLGNCLIKALHKGKRQGLEGPFPCRHPAHQLHGRSSSPG